MYENIEKIYRERLLSQKPLLKDNDIQLNYILKYLSKNRSKFILDAGCGNGNYSFYLSNLGYKNLFAVDLFSSINTEKFKYQQASIDNLPFNSDYFDFIYSNSVIYYLENPNNGIKEFKRVLNKNGVLIFTAHTKYSLFTLWRVFKRDILKLKSMEHLRGVKFYSANYYKKRLEENGFEIILQDGYEISFFFYPFYKKMVRGFFEKIFNKKISVLNPYINNSIIGKLKSEMAYHLVFIARKIND